MEADAKGVEYVWAAVKELGRPAVEVRCAALCCAVLFCAELCCAVLRLLFSPLPLSFS